MKVVANVLNWSQLELTELYIEKNKFLKSRRLCRHLGLPLEVWWVASDELVTVLVSIHLEGVWWPLGQRRIGGGGEVDE